MKKSHKVLIKAGAFRIDDIVTEFRLLRRINAPDTLELTIATDEPQSYIAGLLIYIELHSDAYTYSASFALDNFTKDGDLLIINASSILSKGEKADRYSLAENSRTLAARLGAQTTDSLTSYPVSLSVSKSSKYNALLELAKITRAEVYEEAGALTIADTAIITQDAVVSLELHERRDITMLGVSTTPPVAKSIAVNTVDDETICAKPALILAVDYDPHPVTPISSIVYTKDTQSYTITPLQGRAILYYSPVNIEPTISSSIPFTKKAEYKIVEKFTLESDYSVTLSGGVLSIIDIELDGVNLTDYTYQSGHNVLAWGEPKSGELRVSYASNVYYAQMPPKQAPTNIKIKATHEGLALEHTYKYEYNGYYPLPFHVNLSLIADFALESNDAVNATVDVRRAGVTTQTTMADAFGELEVGFEAYGFYCLTAAGVTRYITIFANEYSISVDKPQGAVC